MQDNNNTPKLQGKGGAGRGQGRKKKSGEVVQFRPSVEVFEILRNKENKTAFIESAIIFYNNNNIFKHEPPCVFDNKLTFAENFGQIYKNEETGFNIFEKDKCPKGVKELFVGTIEELVVTDLYWKHTCTWSKPFYEEETNNYIAKVFIGWLANLYTHPEKKDYLKTIKPETVVVCF